MVVAGKSARRVWLRLRGCIRFRGGVSHWPSGTCRRAHDAVPRSSSASRMTASRTRSCSDRSTVACARPGRSRPRSAPAFRRSGTCRIRAAAAGRARRDASARREFLGVKLTDHGLSRPLRELGAAGHWEQAIEETTSSSISKLGLDDAPCRRPNLDDLGQRVRGDRAQARRESWRRSLQPPPGRRTAVVASPPTTCSKVGSVSVGLPGDPPGGSLCLGVSRHLHPLISPGLKPSLHVGIGGSGRASTEYPTGQFADRPALALRRGQRPRHIATARQCGKVGAVHGGGGPRRRGRGGEVQQVRSLRWKPGHPVDDPHRLGGGSGLELGGVRGDERGLVHIRASPNTSTCSRSSHSGTRRRIGHGAREQEGPPGGCEPRRVRSAIRVAGDGSQSPVSRDRRHRSDLGSRERSPAGRMPAGARRSWVVRVSRSA